MNTKTVKRFLLAGMLLALGLLLLTGCGQPQKTKDLAQVYQQMEGTGHLPTMIALDAEEALNLIGLETDTMAQSVVMLSQNSLLADEVILLETRDKAAADKAYQLLEGRMKAKADEARAYSPEQYAIINKGILKQDGLVLLLLVSPEVDALYAVYNGMK